MLEVNYSKWKLILVFLRVTVIPSLVVGTLPDELETRRPCEYRYAIVMPKSGQCLVPVNSAYNWSRAQAICELAGGSLYQMPLDVHLSHRKLLDCLVSMTTPKLTDVWINPVTQLMPQFRWLHGDPLHQVVYCPTQMPPNSTVGPEGVAPTMESCVAFCRNATADFAFILNRRTSSKCYCVSDLDGVYKTPCDTSTFTYRNTTHLFMAPTSQASVIEVGHRQTVTRGELLCGGVERQPDDGDVQFKSFPCFRRLPFICDLGNSTECPQKLCNHVNCVFPWKGACLRRVDHPLNWLEAHAFCNASGGDLWQMDQLPALTGFSQHIASQAVPYWVGASNFELENGTDSVSLEKFSANFQRVRCGHMQLVQSGHRWQWYNTACDQPKPFICQFGTTTADTGGEATDVLCPWPVGPTATPVDVPLPTAPVPRNTDSFPIAALLSGLLAAIVMLVCLTVCCTCCCRRNAHKNRKAAEKVALVPCLVATNSILSGNHHHNTTDTASNRGSGVLIESVYSQVDSIYHNANTSRADDVHSKNSTRSRDPFQVERIETAPIHHQNPFIADQTSTYSATTLQSMEYMTLEGSMNIEESADFEETLPEKPEVTLVTDNVDLNFTINRSVSLDNVVDDRVSLDRTLEEIQAPVSEGSVTLTLPERVIDPGSGSDQSNA